MLGGQTSRATRAHRNSTATLGMDLQQPGGLRSKGVGGKIALGPGVVPARQEFREFLSVSRWEYGVAGHRRRRMSAPMASPLVEGSAGKHPDWSKK